jgi:hypothetical protein
MERQERLCLSSRPAAVGIVTVDVESLNPTFTMNEDNRLQVVSFRVLVIINLELDEFGSLFTCTFNLQVNQSNSYTIMDSSGYIPASNLQKPRGDIAEYLVGSSGPSYRPIETPGALSCPGEILSVRLRNLCSAKEAPRLIRRSDLLRLNRC